MKKTIFDIKREKLRLRKGKPSSPWDRFYEYLVAEHSTVLPSKPNWEAMALVSMIEIAFDGSGSNTPVEVSPYLVHNLATCTYIALQYGGRAIEWADYDNVLKRTYTGFAHTVIHAIKQGKTHKLEGEECIGALGIPSWFVEWAKNEAVT